MAEPKSSQVLMRELIQRITAFDLADEDIVLGAVEALGTPLHGGNTKITVDLRLPDNFWYSRTIYYNRLNLTTLFNGRDMNFTDDAPVTTTDVANLINARFGLAMDATDYVFAADMGAGQFFNFTAKTDSLVYFGQVPVQLTNGPADDDTIPAGVTETLNATLDGAWVDANGDLVATDDYSDPGTNGSFYVQECPEFKVALRVYDDWNWTADSDAGRVYTMTAGLWDNNSYWNLNIALEAKGKSSILTDYDVTLVIREHLNPANAAVFLPLVVDGVSGLKFANATGGFLLEQVAGGVASTEKAIYDTTGTLSIPGALLGWHYPLLNRDSILGYFKIRVEVRRKSDGVVIINAPIYADATSQGVWYPLQRYNHNLGTESLATAFVDNNDFLITDSNSPSTNFKFSQGTEIMLALRAAVNPDAPVAPINSPNEGVPNLYYFTDVDDQGDTWYIDMFADLHDLSVRGNLGATFFTNWRFEFDIIGWFPPGSTGSGDEICNQYILTWNGSNYVFTDATGRGPVFNPDWVSADGLKFGKRLDIRTFQSWLGSWFKDANNLPMHCRIRFTATSPAGGNWKSDAHIYVKAYNTTPHLN